MSGTIWFKVVNGGTVMSIEYGSVYEGCAVWDALDAAGFYMMNIRPERPRHAV